MKETFRNFRDISIHNNSIKQGVIFRSATLSINLEEFDFVKTITENKIKTIIDLRANREIEEHPYKKTLLPKIKYLNIQLDPWNQPSWFSDNHHQGSNEEIAYRFFTIGCKAQIKQIIETIISEPSGAILIHCHAGKDRTGIIITLLHLLIETPLHIVFSDYLASEMDVKIELLQLILDIINGQGGIVPYLLDCGLSDYQISQVKHRLHNGQL